MYSFVEFTTARCPKHDRRVHINREEAAHTILLPLSVVIHISLFSSSCHSVSVSLRASTKLSAV